MKPKSKIADIAINLFLMVASMVIFFGALETYARCKYMNFNITERGFYSRGRHYLLKKPPDVYRIVCVGGSTTFGGSDYREAYPFYLEQTLNSKGGKKHVEVINSGVAASSTEFHRDIVKDKLSSGELDLLLVHSLYNHFSSFLPFRYNPGVDKTILRDNKVRMVYNWREMSWPDRAKIFLMEHSYFYNLLRETIEKWKRNDAVAYYSKRAGYMLKYSVTEKYEAESEAKKEEILADYLKRYHDAIEDMIKSAVSHHVGIVLVIPPYPYVPEKGRPDLSDFRRHQYYNEVFSKARDVLFSLGKQYGIQVIDTDAEFSKLAYGPDLFMDSVHLTPKGNRVLAEIIAEKLILKGL